MSIRRKSIHRVLVRAAVASAALAAAAPAISASYLFWMPPNFAGGPVKGDEPGIALPLPGATTAELQAHLIWNMRAGLNVAALQCQFAPALATVRNYNIIISQHGAELTKAYTTIGGYFKRTGGKTWQTALDQYTTRIYNGFSTLHAQLGFCEAAASIGREALEQPRGKFYVTAQNRMREFRNSLVPVGDGLFTQRALPPRLPLPNMTPDCWDKNDQMKKKCWALPLS